MDWRTRKNTQETTTENESGIGYNIYPKRDGTFYVEGRLVGGADARLPFNSSATMEDAKAWAEAYEAKQAEAVKRNKRNAISF